MLDLGFVCLLSVWAAGVGLRVVRRRGPASEHPVEALALAVPLGLGLLALATLGLAECGVLTTWGLVAILGLGAWVGRHEGPKAAWSILRACARAGRGRFETSRTGRAIDLALAATILGTLLTASAPVTDGDALCYHLQVPKVFLAHHAAVFDPDLHETVYPLVTEMLYAVALACRGPVACRLVSWVLGLCFAAGVTALARPLLGPRARWAAAVALLVPAISNGMGAPLNDVALAAFGTCALVAWLRWWDRPTLGAAVLAGVLAGLALGVKYPALVWVGLLGLAMLARGRGRIPEGKDQRADSRGQIGHRAAGLSHPGSGIWNLPSGIGPLPSALRARAAHAVPFGVMTLLVGGVWYLRAFLHTGNPVYPFFRLAFAGAGIDAVLDPIKRPLPVTGWDLLTALGPMTLQPDRFDSLSHQLGPAFLLFLPALFLERAPRRLWGLVALGFAFLTICLTQRQSMRFVLIAVGPMAVAVAWLASRWHDRRTVPSRFLLGVVVLMLGFEASLAPARARHGLGVALGRETAEAFLFRREPTYRVGLWIAAHLPETARLVGQDHRGFYIPRPYTMELAHRRRTGLGKRGETAGAIVVHLRREGFTHLLLCPPVPETAVEFDPTLGRRLAPWLAARPPLYREEITDPDGVVRRYAIYDLSAGDPRRVRETHRDPALVRFTHPTQESAAEGIGGRVRR